MAMTTHSDVARAKGRASKSRRVELVDTRFGAVRAAQHPILSDRWRVVADVALRFLGELGNRRD
jgi:hypothetical protein